MGQRVFNNVPRLVVSFNQLVLLTASGRDEAASFV